MGSNTEPRKGKDTVCFGSSKKQNEDYVFPQRQGMKPDGEGEAMGWGGTFTVDPVRSVDPTSVYYIKVIRSGLGFSVAF